MGIFSFLKSDKPAYSDKVWSTKQAAYKGMITDTLLAIRQGQVPLVLVSFEQSRQDLIVFLKEQQVPFCELNSDSTADAALHDKVVCIVNSLSLMNSTSVNSEVRSLVKNGRVMFLFLGHYPLPARDNKIIEEVRKLSPEADLTFYSSLDEPIFNLFGGENLVGLLEKLGMNEEEVIEHSMVRKSMERAREKLQTMVKQEVAADSQEEWFEKNVKQV
jgi:preprotein translocase subunit SecA